MFAAAVAFGRAAGMSWWAIAVLIALLHPGTGSPGPTPSGYMHPHAAFDLSILALAELLRSRYARALGWVAAAACWPTAFWFAIVTGGAMLWGPPVWRRAGLTLAAAALAVGAWAVTVGPLTGRLATMDPTWLAVIAEKDYLFPHEWSMDAWARNLAYPLAILAIYRRRRALGVLAPREPALVAGLMALALVFLVSVPLTTMRLALAVQMQVTRVFWVLDFAAIAYGCWWLMDDRLARTVLGRWLVVALVIAASLGRGAFFLSQDRRLFTTGFPSTPWMEAMTWLKASRPAPTC